MYNWQIGFHKLTLCGKHREFMCIKLSTVKIPQIKGFFEDTEKNKYRKMGVFYRTLDFIGFFAIFT